MSLVSLLYKNGKRDASGNNWPVSLSSHIVKVFDWVLKNLGQFLAGRFLDPF